MRRALLILFVASVAVAAPHPADTKQISVCNGCKYVMPDGIAVPCSNTWTLHATRVITTELVNEWVIDAMSPGDHYILPFVDFPIMVVGYEIVKIDGGPTVWFMIGSGHQPDGFRAWPG